MGVKKFGDWDKIKGRLCNNPGALLAKAIRQATIQNALFLAREIKRGIITQAPGGVPFEALADSTIERKGSSKALIDTGFLLNSITQRILADSAFVGLLRGTVNAKGEDMVNIGAIMEYGATIDMPNGTTIVIPPRPFLHPTMEKYRKQVIDNYEKRIREALSAK
jgi:phage gpG-like protein